jgi:hypothetical protein
MIIDHITTNLSNRNPAQAAFCRSRNFFLMQILMARQQSSCGAGPFLCGSGSGFSLSKILAPAQAQTIFPINFRKISKKFNVS